MLKLIFVWALALFFTGNSLVYTLSSNVTVATFIMWGISIALVVYGLFDKHIDLLLSQGFGQALKIVFLAGVLLYSFLCGFIAVNGRVHTAQNDEAAIIVLGAGLRGDKVDRVLLRRMRAALAAHRQNPDALLVVTGGQGPQEWIPEAVAMQRWLIERGVPESQIIVEANSTSTEENLLFARELLREKGVLPHQPVAIVTNAFHCYRAMEYARALGFSSPRAVPAPMSRIAVLPSYLREVLAVIDLWLFKLPRYRAAA